MKPALITLAVVLSLVALTTVARSGSREMHACGIGVEQFGWLRERAGVIALVDVVEVGDAVNSLPTLTPLPTLTATITPTVGSPTPTLDPDIVVASPTPQPTNTPVSLVGFAATANVVRTYKGAPASSLRIDAQARAGVELAVRHEEQLAGRGIAAPCAPGFGTYRYSPGARYMILALSSGGGVETIYYGRFRLVGDEVILQDETLPYDDWGYLVVDDAMYNTYLSGIQSERFDGVHHIRAPRFPLATLERMITGEPLPVTAPPIVPPGTGSAGLKR
jgi:hypothetical protein